MPTSGGGAAGGHVAVLFHRIPGVFYKAECRGCNYVHRGGDRAADYYLAAFDRFHATEKTR